MNTPNPELEHKAKKFQEDYVKLCKKHGMAHVAVLEYLAGGIRPVLKFTQYGGEEKNNKEESKG